MEKIAVRYIGTKPLKRDTVTDSLAIWPGQNSVCEVPQDVAVRLFLHPDVWVPADAEVIPRPAPVIEEAATVAEEEGVEEAEPVVHPEDEFGYESAPEGTGPVTVEEITVILPSLDKETDFTEHGKPIVGKVRERFPDREVTLAAVRDAWTAFTGA